MSFLCACLLGSRVPVDFCLSCVYKRGGDKRWERWRQTDRDALLGDFCNNCACVMKAWRHLTHIYTHSTAVQQSGCAMVVIPAVSVTDQMATTVINTQPKVSGETLENSSQNVLFHLHLTETMPNSSCKVLNLSCIPTWLLFATD